MRLFDSVLTLALCGPLAAEMVPARAIVTLPDVASVSVGGKPLRLLSTSSAARTPIVIVTPPDLIDEVLAAMPLLPTDTRLEVWAYGSGDGVGVAEFGGEGRIGVRTQSRTPISVHFQPSSQVAYDEVLIPIAQRFAGHTAVRVFAMKSPTRTDLLELKDKAFDRSLDLLGNSGLTEYQIFRSGYTVAPTKTSYQIVAARTSIVSEHGRALARAIVESNHHVEVTFEVPAADPDQTQRPALVTFTSKDGRTETRHIAASSWRSPFDIDDLRGMGSALYRLVLGLPVAGGALRFECGTQPPAVMPSYYVELVFDQPPCQGVPCTQDVLVRAAPAGSIPDLSQPPLSLTLHHNGSTSCAGPVRLERPTDLLFFAPNAFRAFYLHIANVPQSR